MVLQHSNQLCENARENRHYYFGKSRLYGLKTEVLVVPHDITIGSSDTSPGLVTKTTIFKTQVTIHRIWTEKVDEENVDLEDYGELRLTYTNN